MSVVCELLLLDLIDLLLGGLIAGIDLEGAVELGEGAVDVAALAKDAAAVDVGDGGLESHAVEVGFVAEVVGLFEERVADSPRRRCRSPDAHSAACPRLSQVLADWACAAASEGPRGSTEAGEEASEEGDADSLTD